MHLKGMRRATGWMAEALERCPSRRRDFTADGLAQQGGKEGGREGGEEGKMAEKYISKSVAIRNIPT